MSNRRLLALAMVVGFPGALAAQFTTFIPPQNKVADSVKAAVAVEQKAHSDSSISSQLTNMKTWVDSAAGVVADPATPAMPRDSLADTLAATTATDTLALKNGTRAPETASDLPLLAIAGASALIVGLFLIGSGGRETVRTDA